MKSLNFLVVTSFLPLLILVASAKLERDGKNTHNFDEVEEPREIDSYHEWLSHFFHSKNQPASPWRNPRASMTCDKNPRVCESKGSHGPVCCNKICVDVKTDSFNCGECGSGCKFSEVCCNGKCVNPLQDRNHCGGCNNECNGGSLCTFGMCSYA